MIRGLEKLRLVWNVKVPDARSSSGAAFSAGGLKPLQLLRDEPRPRARAGQRHGPAAGAHGAIPCSAPGMSV